MNWASNIAYVLLNTCRTDITVTLIGFSIFAPMSSKGFVYILSIWSIFHYHFHFYYNQSYGLIKKDAIVKNYHILGGMGWTPQSTPRKNWIIFEKKRDNAIIFLNANSVIYFWYNEKKVLKNTDLKPLKIADVSKKC